MNHEVIKARFKRTNKDHIHLGNKKKRQLYMTNIREKKLEKQKHFLQVGTTIKESELG